VIEALARIDTSSAWSLMISAMQTATAGAYLPEAGVLEVFAEGIPVCAGLILPSGQLRARPGGFRVDGRWAFGSGIRHADWVVTSAVLAEPGVSYSPGSFPEMRTIVMRAQELVIEDTWHALGLRGSGSEHYRVEAGFVPEHRTFAFPRAAALRGGPSFDLPFIALVSSVHSGFVLGAARAALDEIVRIAPTRTKRWTSVPWSEHAGFQLDLGRADAELRAARAFAYEAAQLLEQRCGQGRPLSNRDWSITRSAVTLATETAVKVTQVAFHAGGGEALYQPNLLERLLRDVLAAGQHAAGREEAFEFTGRWLLGNADSPILHLPREPRASPERSRVSAPSCP
jgi:alkylation response protein AidB-like acyl-CoA dehydrogenase